MEQYSEEETCLLAMQLSAGTVVSMALKSALELDLLQLIRKGYQPNSSAAELAAQFPTTNPEATSMIDRLLRLLAAHSVLECSLSDDGSQRRYSIGPVGEFFVGNEDSASLSSFTHLIQDKVMMKTWYNLKDAILEGGIPFNKAHGMSLFEYTSVDKRFNDVFNHAMSQPTILLKKILGMYRGFEGIKSLVDVGGGIGTTINMIISKYPSMKGINFDLSHVIRDAPSYRGVEHVGGDMFVSVPKGDAIFMKWIIHDWSDADCVKILRNCYKSLPKNGKVIIIEHVLPEIPISGPAATALQWDIMMLAYVPGGKERTEKEFCILAKQVGFEEFRKVCGAYNQWVMELYK